MHRKRERVALVEFKNDLIDAKNRLVSWSSKEDDCCKWAGIVCDNNTGHVRQIRLGSEESAIFSGKINPSLLTLKNLEYLDLSYNDFQWVQIPKFIGSLHNLRYLNLAYSNFYGEIPSQLGNLSKLHTLYLSGGYFSSDLSSNLGWLSGLLMMQNLDMSGVDLSKASDWLHVISSLPSLVELRMSSCGLLTANLSTFSVNSSSLFRLDLSGNPDLSDLVFHNMTSLRELYASGNPFMNKSTVLMSLSSSGLTTLDISSCELSSSSIHHLQNMTSLVVLDLQENQLTKEIPKSFGNLCDLRELRLSDNNFGEMGLLEILKVVFECDSSNLESLEIRKSNVSGHLLEQVGNFHNLINIDLSVNSLSGSIPNSIGSLSSLRRLDLSENQLNGNLPPSIGQLCELETLCLVDNRLSGMVTEDHFANLTKLKVLSASNNSLTLKLHSEKWVPPFQLLDLELNSWNIGPRFPLWLQLQTKLQKLRIHNTRISDIIPDWFWTRNSDLVEVDVSYNQIRGTISKIPPKGEHINLSYNNFSGPFPKMTLIHKIDLRCNNFSGSLPKLNTSDWGWSFYIDLSSNSFSGSMKPLLCESLMVAQQTYYLDVSNNNLSGVIPECWKNWNSLETLGLENNNFLGEIPDSFSHLYNIELLNMRNNKLVGKLPDSLKNLTRLKIFQLSQNKLMGNIPSWFGSFTDLEILELRANRFSGDVSNELCLLVSLRVLDLAHNDLSGDIPKCFKTLVACHTKIMLVPWIWVFLMVLQPL